MATTATSEPTHAANPRTLAPRQPGPMPPPSTRPPLAARACYFLLGAGLLAAWNALITGTDYFGAVYPGWHTDRLFTLCYLPVCFVMLGLGTRYPDVLSARARIRLGYAGFTAAMAAVPLLDALLVAPGEGGGGPAGGGGGGDGGAGEAAAAGPVGALAAVLVCVVAVGVCDGLCQGALFGEAARLHPQCTHAVVTGTASSGLLVCLLRIVSKASFEGAQTDAERADAAAGDGDPAGGGRGGADPRVGLRNGTRLYFALAGLLSLACLLVYDFVLPRVCRDPANAHAGGGSGDGTHGVDDGEAAAGSSERAPLLRPLSGELELSAHSADGDDDDKDGHTTPPRGGGGGGGVRRLSAAGLPPCDTAGAGPPPPLPAVLRLQEPVALTPAAAAAGLAPEDHDGCDGSGGGAAGYARHGRSRGAGDEHDISGSDSGGDDGPWVHRSGVPLLAASRDTASGTAYGPGPASKSTGAGEEFLFTAGQETGCISDSGGDGGGGGWLPPQLRRCLGLGWQLCGGLFLTYAVTLSIFPGFLAEDVHSADLGDWYPILLITAFNAADLVGKSLPCLAPEEPQQQQPQMQQRTEQKPPQPPSPHARQRAPRDAAAYLPLHGGGEGGGGRGAIAAAAAVATLGLRLLAPLRRPRGLLAAAMLRGAAALPAFVAAARLGAPAAVMAALTAALGVSNGYLTSQTLTMGPAAVLGSAGLTDPHRPTGQTPSPPPRLPQVPQPPLEHADAESCQLLLSDGHADATGPGSCTFPEPGWGLRQQPAPASGSGTQHGLLPHGHEHGHGHGENGHPDAEVLESLLVVSMVAGLNAGAYLGWLWLL